jgi:hypothetical protein
MFGFGALSEAPFSAQMVTTHPAEASLSTSASITSTAVMSVTAAGLASGPATLSAVGALSHAAKAVLSSDSPCTSGFTQGFQRGSFLTGYGTVQQTGLNTLTVLTANGTIERLSDASLSGSVTFIASHAIVSSLKSIGSLSGNSVLLHSGSVNLNALAILIHDQNRPDVVSFTSYIDKVRNIDGNMGRTQDLIAYIDKQFSADANIDLSGDIISYIDKVVEKTLVRER